MSIIYDALKKAQKNLMDRNHGGSLVRDPAKDPADRKLCQDESIAAKEPRPSQSSVSRPEPGLPSFVPPAPVESAKTKIPLPQDSPARLTDGATKKDNIMLIFAGGLVCFILISMIIALFRIYLQSHAAAPQAKEDIMIKGVLTQGDKQVVLINDRIYEIGETVDGVKIVGISLDSVEVFKDGHIQTLQVSQK